MVAVHRPGIAARSRDPRLISAIVMAMAVAGLMGCLFALATIWVWTIRQGIGQGARTLVAQGPIVLR
jgi:CP family cyanate transporter-like MFS transporter